MAKVLLIDPPGFNNVGIGRILGSFGSNKANQMWPPYDLQIMAGYCKKNNHEFHIIDSNNLKMDFNDVKNEIENHKPDWVIYLTCFPTFLLDAKVADSAKAVNKNIHTACMSLSIMSVQDADKKLEQLLNLDYIIWGEPEIPLMKLINGEKPETVNGLYFRDDTGKIIFTGEADKPKKLDELGVPIHYDLPNKIYSCPISIKKPMTIVNCSRGCSNWCVHCQAGAFQRSVRYRSVENVLEELREIKKLGIREIKFYDCSLPTNRRFAMELCDAMIKEKFNFTWNCNSRAEMLDEEMIAKMKLAGCHTIEIGCESSVDEILKNMRKNETAEQIETAVKLVKKSGLRVLMYLTFGLEGETKETMKQTFDFVKKLKPEFVTFGIVVPAPGTPFYETLAGKGQLIDKDLEWLDPNALPSFKYPDLHPEEILSFTRNAYRTYYFSPSYILRRMLKLRTFQEFASTVSGALSVFTRYFIERTK